MRAAHRTFPPGQLGGGLLTHQPEFPVQQVGVDRLLEQKALMRSRKPLPPPTQSDTGLGAKVRHLFVHHYSPGDSKCSQVGKLPCDLSTSLSWGESDGLKEQTTTCQYPTTLRYFQAETAASTNNN